MSKKEKKPKSKKFKIILTSIILSIFTCFGLWAGLWFGYTNPSLSKKMNYDNFYSTWMSYIKDETKITEVIMPGSHDAGTKGMMPQAMCQGHSILEQLEGGVRYFDIRVTNKEDQLVIFHGPIKGRNFEFVINDFVTFINENPSEFIIIDFQHVGPVRDAIILAINTLFPLDKMLSASKYPNISEVSMKTIREEKLNYLITWNDKKEAEENNFYFRDDSLKSDYDGVIHKQSDEALIKQFDAYYKNSDPNKLFVLQAQRTAKTLLGKPSMYELNFKPKVNKFIADLNNNKELLNKTNIIMRDFIISDKKNINLILALNISKNIVKSEYLNSYQSFIK